MAAAISGVLTVFGIYLLAKELFSFNNGIKSPAVIALLSSFFLAISFWHTSLSRIGFRAILLPLVLVFSFYFFLRGLKSQGAYHFVLSGAFFGLGFYTYTSFRLAVLILPFLFIPYWLLSTKENIKKKATSFIAFFLLIVFIVALPLGLYFLKHPHDFISRATPISVFSAEKPLNQLLQSLALHLGMFNFYGDPNWRHNYATSPMLFWPVGIFFLVGLFYSCWQVLKTKEKRILKTFPYYFLISWWFIMLLPGILTWEGIPHSLRVAGTIPAVYIFSGLGAWQSYLWLKENFLLKKKQRFFIFVSLVFLVSLVFSQFNKYFFYWGQNEKVKEAFTEHYFEIGNFLNALPQETKKYVIVNEPGTPLYGVSIPGQTPMFVEAAKYKKPRAVYLRFEEIDKIKPGKEKTIIVPLYDGRTFQELEKRFPQGKIFSEKGIIFFQINGL